MNKEMTADFIALERERVTPGERASTHVVLERLNSRGLALFDSIVTPALLEEYDFTDDGYDLSTLRLSEVANGDGLLLSCDGESGIYQKVYVNTKFGRQSFTRIVKEARLDGGTPTTLSEFILNHSDSESIGDWFDWEVAEQFARMHPNRFAMKDPDHCPIGIFTTEEGHIVFQMLGTHLKPKAYFGTDAYAMRTVLTPDDEKGFTLSFDSVRLAKDFI